MNGSSRDARIKAEFKPNAIPFSVESRNASGLDSTVVEAAYLIDAAVLRAHVSTGVTLCAKNLFGATSINPDWRKNEAAYWTVRDQLLAQYQGQWIGFADDNVLVAASTPLEVFLAVRQSGRHPFVIRVGHENEPWYRIRQTSFGCDTACPGVALPPPFLPHLFGPRPWRNGNGFLQFAS